MKWKQEFPKNSLKLMMNRLVVSNIGLFLVALVACTRPNASAGIDTTIADHPFKIIFRSIPERWLAGDSIKLEIESISSVASIEPENPEIAIPFLDMAKIDFLGPRVHIHWATDSVPWLGADGMYVLFSGSYLENEKEILYKSTEVYDILQDSLGYYYFQLDKSSYRMDTFQLE